MTHYITPIYRLTLVATCLIIWAGCTTEPRTPATSVDIETPAEVEDTTKPQPDIVQDTHTPPTPGDVLRDVTVADITPALNASGFNLFAYCAKEDSGEAKNTIISPFSIATALIMTYNGAAEETRAQMAEVLHITGMPNDGLNAASAALIHTLENADPSTTLAIANSLWATEEIPFKKPFMSRVQKYFDAAIFNVDFLDPTTHTRINDWVENATRDKITDLVKKDDLNEDTLLILINALYFFGEWQFPFDEKRTHEHPFHLSDGSTIDVNMMDRDGEYFYGESENWQAVRLPYGESNRFAMTLILPSEETSADTFATSMTLDTWRRIHSSMQRSEGRVALPRFTLEYEVALRPALSALGMPIAFEEWRADFTHMCTLPPGENAYLSEVRHKTFIEVNEKGTEAAAATAVVVMRVTSAMPTERFSFVCDRPFLFVISDQETDAILFLGIVRNPLR